ncbi:DUF397 domain-containing protein [Streptomyces sp. 2RAF24]
MAHSDSGSTCIEVAFTWTKSSYSSEQGGDCIEVATCPHAIHIRDSKDTARPAFTVSPAAWSAFLQAADEAHVG